MKSTAKNQRRLLAIVYIITAVAIIHSFYFNYVSVDSIDFLQLVFFVFLTAISESFTVVFKNISFSLSFAVNIVCYVLFGPFNCMIIMVLGYLFRVIKIEENEYIHVFNTPIYGTIFNCCALVLPMVIGNYIYILMDGKFQNIQIGYSVLPIIVISLVYFLINVVIMSMLIAVRNDKSTLICILGNLGMSILSIIVIIPISIFAIIMFQKYSYIGILMVSFLLFFVRYTLILYSTSKEQFAETISALMNSVEARDKYTNGHSRRVAEISTLIARKLKLSVWEIEKLNVAAMLHDVGKIGISDNILQKPGKLTDEEFAIIKSHPEIGMSIIKDIKNIDYVHPIVRHHHERYDGKGYPDGKKGEELSLMVYIVQLADAVDAMASDRPYRRGLPQEVIIEEIKKGVGTQFHPKVANIYLDILKEQGSKAFMKEENNLSS